MSSFSIRKKPFGLKIDPTAENIEQPKTPIKKSSEDIIVTLLPNGSETSNAIQLQAINNYKELNTLPPDNKAIHLFRSYYNNPSDIKILAVHNRMFPGQIQYTTIVIEEGNFIYKFFVYNCEDAPTVDAHIIREITIQMYASTTISQTCDFLTPGIYNYNKFNETIEGLQKCIFYFKMDKMTLLTLEKIIKNDLKLNKLKLLEKELIDINTCIEGNNIFHNDLNSGNILIDDKIKEFGIIDFGEATTKRTNVTDNNFEKILGIIRGKIADIKSNEESESRQSESRQGKRKLDSIYSPQSQKTPANDIKLQSRKRSLSDVYKHGGLKKTGKNRRKINKNTKKRKTYNKHKK